MVLTRVNDSLSSSESSSCDSEGSDLEEVDDSDFENELAKEKDKKNWGNSGMSWIKRDSDTNEIDLKEAVENLKTNESKEH